MIQAVGKTDPIIFKEVRALGAKLQECRIWLFLNKYFVKIKWMFIILKHWKGLRLNTSFNKTFHMSSSCVTLKILPKETLLSKLVKENKN